MAKNKKKPIGNKKGEAGAKPKISLKEKLGSTKTIVQGTIGVVVILIILMIFQSCAPRKANILYGMCRSFLELQVPFPETIEQKEIELYRTAVRMNYTHLDGFGEYRLEMIECSFEQHPQNGVQLNTVFFNYVKPSTSKERTAGKGRLYAVEQEHILTL